MTIVCTPTGGTIEGGTVVDLVELIKHSPEASFSVSQGSILPQLRTGLVREAIDRHIGHILFIDSDMRFPKDLLEKLKSHGKDIIGANYKQRNADKWVIGESSVGKHGVEEVETIGFGALLIRTEVFVLTPEPWFAMPYDGRRFVGEDVFFCHKAKDAGYKIFVDHDISHYVKHIAKREI